MQRIQNNVHRFFSLQEGEPDFLLFKCKLCTVISFQRTQNSVERAGQGRGYVVEKPEKLSLVIKSILIMTRYFDSK